MNRSKGLTLGYWVFTAVFCLHIGFTAYAQLALPQVADSFAHFGFPDYFRVQLAWAKLAGIIVLLAPVAARLKEWAYSAFFLNIVFAITTHIAVGDGVDAWRWALGAGVLCGLSYFFWRRLEAAPVFQARELQAV
jgi:hypothetical protein